MSELEATTAMLALGESSIAVKRIGRGWPVVCLHALGHDMRDFERFAAAVRDEFEVIALDWPGHGLSAPDGRPVAAERYAQLLLDACDALGLERPIVIGNSIGGAAAAIAAAAAPERFAGLVLCNAGGFAPIDPFARAAIGLMVRFFEAGARGVRWFPRAFALYYRTCVLSTREAATRRAQIVDRAPHVAPLLAEGWRSFAEPAADIRATAARIDIPVWLAWAKHDVFVAWSRSKIALGALRRSHTTLFDASHTPFVESPAAFESGFRVFGRRCRRLVDGTA